MRATKTNETKLVVFNDLNSFLFGLDGSGQVNVTLDGKGVAQLNIGRYARVITSIGPHQIDLVHLDIGHFRSHHSIELIAAEYFLEVYATPVGNEIEFVPALPQNFEKKFKPVY